MGSGETAEGEPFVLSGATCRPSHADFGVEGRRVWDWSEAGCRAGSNALEATHIKDASAAKVLRRHACI